MALLLTLVGPGARAVLAPAPLPPMGYNTWNDFECNLKEADVRKTAEKLKELGFLDLGYSYFSLGDCWLDKERSSSGQLQPDKTMFPSGLPALSQAVRKLGFKFGVLTDRGPTTCVGLPASMGHEDLDAKTFADWGVDIVKNDGCWDPDCGEYQAQFPGSGVCDRKGRIKAASKYQKMAKALTKSSRDIIHWVSGWQPWYAPVGRKLGQMWRVSADVRDWESVYETSRVMEQLAQYSGPGGWTDADMLLGSSPGGYLSLTPRQSRAQFCLWSVMASPLMLGVSVLHMTSWDLETYTNKDVIRINQDPLGKPGRMVSTNCPAYPQLKLSLMKDGAPHIEVPLAAKYQAVVCGSHSARSCSECPRGHGKGWCHGQCRWVSATKKCVPADNNADRPIPSTLVDKPEPWSIAVFRNPDMRQCHTVWTKELSSGEIALVVVNFGSAPATLSLPLDSLELPWAGSNAFVRDLWYTGPVTGMQMVFDTLELSLKPEGGHAMLQLRQAPNGTGACTGGSSRRTEGSLSSLSEPVLPRPEERLKRAVDRLRVRERMAQAGELEEEIALMDMRELSGWGAEGTSQVGIGASMLALMLLLLLGWAAIARCSSRGTAHADGGKGS